jgi:hypothetical protein
MTEHSHAIHIARATSMTSDERGKHACKADSTLSRASARHGIIGAGSD